MPKYLLRASFTPDGLRGVLREGGTARRTAVEQTVASIGGTLEAFYFAFGERDTYSIIDAPADAEMAALGATLGASGAVKVDTIVLLSPEEIDEAAEKTVGYRPPGA